MRHSPPCHRQQVKVISQDRRRRPEHRDPNHHQQILNQQHSLPPSASVLTSARGRARTSGGTSRPRPPLPPAAQSLPRTPPPPPRTLPSLRSPLRSPLLACRWLHRSRSLHRCCLAAKHPRRFHVVLGVNLHHVADSH